jgi:hypothetical protein
MELMAASMHEHSPFGKHEHERPASGHDRQRLE